MSIKGGKIGELYIIGCGICFHWSGWLDQRFLSGGGPSDTLHLILCSAAPLAWFSGLLTLTAATSASLHNRFLLSFYTTSFLSRLTAELPAFNWQGIDYQTARVTLVSYTGGDEEQPCCTVSPRPAAHQSLTDSTVRCNIALCLHQKWLVLFLLPSYSILYVLINVTTDTLCAIFSLLLPPLPGLLMQTPSWWGTWRTVPAAWTTSPPEPWEPTFWSTMATVVSVSVF